MGGHGIRRVSFDLRRLNGNRRAIPLPLGNNVCNNNLTEPPNFRHRRHRERKQSLRNSEPWSQLREEPTPCIQQKGDVRTRFRGSGAGRPVGANPIRGSQERCFSICRRPRPAPNGGSRRARIRRAHSLLGRSPARPPHRQSANHQSVSGVKTEIQGIYI